MSIEIDGVEVEASGTILDCLLAAGIGLPHLCKDDNLQAIGACRTCLVEADGRIVAACSFPATGLKSVRTQSERALRLRQGVLQLTAAMCTIEPGPRGPEGATLDQALDHERARGNGLVPRARHGADTTNAFFAFAESECILCGRCVSACQSLQHISAIGMAGRGAATRVTPGAGVSFLESICTSCGSCVAACPTDALRPKTGGFE